MVSEGGQILEELWKQDEYDQNTFSEIFNKNENKRESQLNNVLNGVLTITILNASNNEL